MSRYVYKQLNWVDVAVLVTFVFGPVFYLIGDFLLHTAGLIFVVVWTSLWILLALVWLSVAIWWIGHKLRRIFTRT